MADSGLMFPRFCLISSGERSIGNKIDIPASFVVEHGEELGKYVKFQLPNGYESSAIYKKRSSEIYGVVRFLGMPPFESKCCSVFNYLGNGKFLVYAFTDNLCEVEYALTGLNTFVQDKISGIGWKFLSVCICQSSCDRGAVRVPDEFFVRFGNLIPSEVRLNLPNGQAFNASYTSAERAMIGISSVQFKIQIQPYQLYKYCYGIDIVSDFKACTSQWSRGDYLTIAYRGNYFFLEIRKTDHRWKIHHGWLRFAQLLKLSVGDVLAFNMTTPPLGFSVVVYRLANRQ